MGNYYSTVEKECNLLVLGEKGVGKTSFLKALGANVYASEKLTLTTANGPIIFNIKGCQELENVIDAYTKANVVMVMYPRHHTLHSREKVISRYLSEVKHINKDDKLIFITCAVEKHASTIDVEKPDLTIDGFTDHFAIGNGPLISHVLPIFSFLVKKITDNEETEVIFNKE